MNPEPDEESELVFPDDPDPIEPWPIPAIVSIHTENATGWSSPYEPVYLEEHPSGDIFERVKNDLKANHGVGHRADVRVYESGRYDLWNVREIPESKEVAR